MKRNLLFAFLAITGFLFGMASCQKAPELTLTSSSNIEFSADGSSGSITFTANRDWTARAYDSWVSVSPTSGTASDGAVTVTVRCNANTTYEDRSTTVTISMGDLSQTVSVKQPANKGIVLPKQVFDLQSDTRSIDVEVQANVQYSVSTSANWIKQVGTKALSSRTLSFSIEENKTYDPREGKITIKPTEGNVQEQVITVRQAQKAAMNVEKTSYEMPYGGGEIEIKVEANVAFTVTPNVDWLHYIQTKALTNSTVCIKVDENTTYSNREGKIEIAQQNGSLKHTITVKQASRIAVSSVELNKTSLQMKEGDTETLVATVKPDNATDKTVNWSSSDASIASVDENGKVTAIKEGSATIIAKAGEKSTNCFISVVSSAQEIISFADPAAKKACVAKYDKNGDGEVSVQEAEAVTSFDGLFNDWRSVASFDEIRFFKNVHSLNGVFRECNKLVSITIPDNITSLGTYSFYGCFSLESVTLPSSLSSIGAYSFYECKSLTSIDIPMNVTSIGESAFMGCYQLRGIIIPEKTTTLGEGAFYQCSSLSSVVFLGNHVFAIPRLCFYRCQSLESITLPDGISSIGDNAFEDVAMWKLVVPSSVTSIGNYNFTGIKNVLLPSKTFVSIENRTFGSNGVIFVPADMLDTYKLRTNWDYYALLLYPLEAYKDKADYSLQTKGAVNMGLSVKWAAYNIGATKPEEFGDYYAWGEIETKNNYNWESYRFRTSGDIFNNVKFSKYVTMESYGPVDNKTTLDLEDDVAHVKWGENWRMPTAEEINELTASCIWETTEYNKVKGSMVYGVNSGNIIFIPAAGLFDGKSVLKNEKIYIWSSGLDETQNHFAHGCGGGQRKDGLSVRPVIE